MRRPIIAAALLTSLALTLTSCDTGGDDPPPADGNDAPTAAIDAPSQVAVGQQLTFDGSSSTDPDGDDLTFAWEFGDGSSSSGETVTHTYDSAGDFDVTLTVTDDDGAADTGNTEIAATELGPDSLMVTYHTETAGSGDPLASEYTLDGTPKPELSGTASGSFIIESGSGTRELCTTNTVYFQPACATFQAAGANQTLLLSVNRKTVSVSVSATPSSATVQVRNPATDSLEAEATGQLQTELPKRSGDRKLVAFKPGYERDSVLVEASADASESFQLSELPACSNGIDDDGDGFVDVWQDLNGNNIPDVGDAGDPGCPGPADDNEAHVVRTVTFPGVGTSDSVFVSSDPDHWKLFPGSSEFSQSITVAVGNVFFGIDAKLSSAQSDEAFAVQFMCGSRTNISETVEDDPSVDGWYTPVVLGITPDFFAESTDCEFTAVHKAFVNDNPGDGNDDVIFGYPERTGSYVISWVYQPDTVSNEPASRQGRSTFRDKVLGTARDGDVSVRRSGYVNSSLE